MEENILVLCLEFYLHKVSKDYTDLRCFLDIKVLTQQAKGSRAPSDCNLLF